MDTNGKFALTCPLVKPRCPADPKWYRAQALRAVPRVDQGRALDDDFLEGFPHLVGASGERAAEMFEDLQIRVVDHVSEGERVVSRWVMAGSNRGRRAEMSGITISRLADGHIVEDWTALDSLELLRQLGLVRALLGAPRLLRAIGG